MSTRATTKMEALLEEVIQQNKKIVRRMDKQSEQISEHLRMLSQQQSERVDGIAQKQKETEQEVSAIAGDLSSVKLTVEGRLSAMESSVSGLTNQLRTEVGESRESLKQELRVELLRELGATPGLRPAARPFTPSDPNTEAIGGQTNRVGDTSAAGRTPLTPSVVQQRPAPFDGTLAWDAYHAQFELLAEMNRWDRSEKATYLAISLKGAAATVLTNLPPEKRHDYAALTTALDSRFGATHQTELNRMRLKSRTRHRDETLAELAEDVERLSAAEEAAGDTVSRPGNGQ